MDPPRRHIKPFYSFSQAQTHKTHVRKICMMLCLHKNIIFVVLFITSSPEMSEAVLEGVADVHDGKIVGIHASSLGRSCTRHVVCGQELEVSDIIRFRQELKLVDEEAGAASGAGRALETVVKAILIKHGQESCTLGFIPRHIALCPDVSRRLLGQFAQIIELYDLLDEGTYKQTKSIHNHGMAAYILLNDTPILEKEI